MIKTVHGDVLAVERGIILHGCNAQGVMGSGIARQVKEQFPGAYKIYKDIEEEHGLALGSVIWKATDNTHNKWIGNCITQLFYGTGKRHIEYEAVAKCMENVVDFMEGMKFDLPICFPQIGAGLGGGNWKIISTIIDEIIPDKYEKILYLYKE